MTPLLLVIAAVALAPLPGRRPRLRSAGATDPGRPSRVLRALAALGLAGALVAVLGPAPGGLAALVAGPLAWLGLGRIRTAPTLAAGREIALVLDLTAAALRAGRPPDAALRAAAPAAEPDVREAFVRVAGLLRLGAEPGQAWAALARDGPLVPVATVAVRSASSGARLATAFERLAVELRAERVAVAAARAQRAGVLAMAPLGLCFLPSFVLLGVVPVVVGVARTAFGGLP